MLSIPGYLERLEFIRFGNLSIRVHWIKDIDRTPFLHTHPFTYLSIVLSGGYTEEILDGDRLLTKKHPAGAFIFRRNTVPHRIIEVLPGTKTLFFARYNSGWELINHPMVKAPEGYHDLPDGMYWVSQRFHWKRRENGRWYKSFFKREEARSTQALSIFQNLDSEVQYRHALDPTE